MNVFYEFSKIAEKLHENKVHYALIGGVATAFYSQPRYTRDIDILTIDSELENFFLVLKNEGYFQSAPAWTFKNTKLSLIRFMKLKNNDEMFVDILIAKTAIHKKMITNANEIELKETGVVRVVNKQDLIKLKKVRNSMQDVADIERINSNEQC